MSREKTLAKNTLILSIGTLLPKLTSFIVIPVLTLNLTKAEYGIFDLVQSLLVLIVPIILLRLETSAFRFMIDSRQNKEELTTIISSIICIVIPLIFIAGILPFFVFNFNQDVILFISVYIALESLVSIAGQIVRGLGKTLLYSMSFVVSSFVSMVLIVISVHYLKLGLRGIFLTLCFSSFTTLVILVIKSKLYRYLSMKSFSKNKLRQMLAYSIPMIPGSLSAWIMNLSSKMVILFYMGIEAYAVFSIAYKIPSLLKLAYRTYNVAWTESASLTVKDDDANNYYSSMFDNIFLILVGVLSLLIAFSPLIFFLFVKGNYNAAFNQMPILFLSMLFYSLSSFLGGIYLAHKKTANIAYTTIVSAVINLVFSFILVRIIGLYGASLAMLFSYVFLFVYRARKVNEFQPVYYNNKRIILLLLVLTIQSIACLQNSFTINTVNTIFAIFFSIILNKKVLNILLSKLYNFVVR